MDLQQTHSTIKSILFVMLGIVFIPSLVMAFVAISQGNVHTARLALVCFSLTMVGVRGSFREHYLSSLVYSVALIMFTAMSVAVAVWTPIIYTYLIVVFLAIFSSLFVANTIMIHRKTVMNTTNEGNADNEILL